MTATVAPPNTTTTFPGTTRRRVWAGPAVASHAAVVLTAARLALVPAGAAFDAGTDPADAPPAGHTIFDLGAIRLATLHLDADAIAIELDGRRAPVVVLLSDAATADDVFTQLVRRCGTGYALATDRPSRLALARTPLGVMAGVGVAAGILAVTVSGLPDVVVNLPDPPVWLRALARLDWRLVTGTGGVALAAAQVWLYRRLARPPARLTLRRL